MQPIALRTDISSTILRQAAKTEKDSGICRRLLGMAHLIEGGSRSEAQKIACLTVNTFRTWIKRMNVEGINGLKPKKSTGRPSKLTLSIKEKLKAVVLQGPSEKEGVVRYRLVDLQAYLKNEHRIKISISGVWCKLQELGITWKTGRQRHPKSSEEVQEDFKKKFQKPF